MGLTYRIAATQEEFDQIHNLNYRTFVEEIPQHEQNDSQLLIDTFHSENTYLICLKDKKLVGMMAVRSNLPFSLDKKLEDVEKLLPFTPNFPCEIRLLAIEADYRNGRVFFGLGQILARYCLKRGYDCALISGTTRQLKLYTQLGFKAFGPILGSDDVQYQPMYLTKETYDASLAGRFQVEPVNFLPGPVTISESVKKAVMLSPISHRSLPFSHAMTDIKRELNSLTNSTHVQILLGTGTLANDVVAGQLHLLGGKGLILANGEFGNRITDHAKRFSLSFDVLNEEWGKSFNYQQLEAVLREKNYEWLWFVHCETSTGMLNDLNIIVNLCRRYQVKLCVDCISSVGAVPLNLEHVYLATGVSGKAIGSYSGLSFVFHQHEVIPSEILPRYLDLGIYAAKEDVPYTQSSNLVLALKTALLRYKESDVHDEIKTRGSEIIRFLHYHKIAILTNKHHTAPSIVTIALPPEISAQLLGEELYLNGYLLHYESNYLQERNWIQIACISTVSEKNLQKMLKLFVKVYEELI